MSKKKQNNIDIFFQQKLLCIFQNCLCYQPSSLFGCILGSTINTFCFFSHALVIVTFVIFISNHPINLSKFSIYTCEHNCLHHRSYASTCAIELVCQSKYILQSINHFTISILSEGQQASKKVKDHTLLITEPSIGKIFITLIS